MGLSFQIKQYGRVMDYIRPRAEEDVESDGVKQILRSSAFMFLFCVAVSVARLLLSEEGCMGLWPPGSADGEWQVNPSLAVWLVCEPCQLSRWRNNSQWNHSWVLILKPPAPSAEYKWDCVGSKLLQTASPLPLLLIIMCCYWRAKCNSLLILY